MAGDNINATVLYYHQGSAGGNSSNIVNLLLGSLGQAISGGNAATNLVKGNSGNITSQLSGVGGFINAVQPGGSNPPDNTPQAFLTILFFDERFNFIPAADGGVAQLQVAAGVGSNGSSLTLANIKAPKNGYAYVYISNQSNNDVYFDDLQVGITAGNIIEENHYYAYGLKIVTISGKKLGNGYEGQLKNSFLYNDKELFDEADLSWYDYGFRYYDPQIGRFPQLDPLTFNYPYLTPYQYASCEPIANIDIDGLEAGSAIARIGADVLLDAPTGAMATVKTLGDVVVKSSTKLTLANKLTFALSTGNYLKAVQVLANCLNKTTPVQVGIPQQRTDNTYIRHNFDSRNGPISPPYDYDGVFDVTGQVTQYGEYLSTIVGKDKLAEHLKTGGKVFFIGKILNRMATNDGIGMVKDGLDYLLENNVYYFFYKNVVMSNTTANKALTNLYVQHQVAKKRAINASDNLKNAEMRRDKSDIRYWRGELESRNGAVIELEKEMNRFVEFMGWKVQPPAYKPNKVRPINY